jgi:hypothetical protein
MIAIRETAERRELLEPLAIGAQFVLELLELARREVTVVGLERLAERVERATPRRNQLRVRDRRRPSVAARLEPR